MSDGLPSCCRCTALCKTMLTPAILIGLVPVHEHLKHLRGGAVYNKADMHAIGLESKGCLMWASRHCPGHVRWQGDRQLQA